MTTTKIYALINPIDKTPQYIGKSNNPIKRLAIHIHSTLNKRGKLTKKEAWIKSLYSKNLFPQLEVLDEVPITEWAFWEKHYISLYRSWGFDLKNGTDGGDCGPSMTGKKLSKEHIKKIQEGRAKVKDLISKNISLSKKGKSQSEEHIAALSIVRKGRSVWNKGKTGLISKKRGTHINDEQKEKQSLRAKLETMRHERDAALKVSR